MAGLSDIEWTDATWNPVSGCKVLSPGCTNCYAMRMAAVFTLTTVTIARRTEIVSRWLSVAGLVAAVVLLVGVGISPWVELLFPLWILALSIDILLAGLRAARVTEASPA